MPNVFISYRRNDSAGYAGRLTDSLEPLLGSGKIFRDVEGIKPGDDFVKAIEHNLQNANAVLVVIGKDWLTAKDDTGELRLSDPTDFVRLEIEAAFRYKHPVIPVLVENAVMPKPEDLPESIAPLAYRQAIEVSDTRWDDDINRLLKALAIPQGNAAKPEIRHWLMPKAGKLQRLSLILFVLFATGLLGFLGQWYFFVPDYSGNWYFEGGDYLLIKQEGKQIEIEHIDPAIQTTYDKGTGNINGRRLEFDLVPIYTTQFRYRGDLGLSWDKDNLKGNLVEILSNETIPIELTRTNPAKKQ